MQAVENTVGEVVRTEMARQGISMLELSRRTNVPRSTLAHQVNNDSLTVANLLLIAQALRVEATLLLIGRP